MASAQVIEAIKARLPISSVVKEAVKLRSQGTGFLGLCPFHNEKTPSFSVRDAEGRFKCFGCGTGGDVFEFVMKTRGIGFKETLLELAQRANVALPKEYQKEQLNDASPQVKPLKDLQALAQKYFVDTLLNADPKSHFRHYLEEKRGLSKAMIKEAGLGFGGDRSEPFFAVLRGHHAKKSTCIKAGLLTNTTPPKAQFLQRITFPIRDFQGTIVGFGGRALEEGPGVPKYLNSHSNELYDKSQSLYGLYESRKAIVRGAIPVVVEGYFDAMAFWAIGMPSVALCGTALSKDHLRLLKNHVSGLILCFDNDQAGVNALKKALPLIFSFDMAAHLIEIPVKDPGTYLSEKNLAELKEISTTKKDAFCYLVDQLSFNSLDIRQKVQELDGLIPIFQSIKRPILRRQYVAYCAKRLGQDPALLWSEIESKRKKTKTEPTVQEDNRRESIVDEVDKLVLQIVALFPLLSKNIGPSTLKSLNEDVHQLIWRFNDGALHEDFLTYLTNTNDKRASDIKDLLEVLLPNKTIEREEIAEEILLKLEERYTLKAQKRVLEKAREEIKKAEERGDFSRVLQGLKEQSAILAKSKNVLIKKKQENDEQKAKPNGAKFLKSNDVIAPPSVLASAGKEVLAILDEEDEWLF